MSVVKNIPRLRFPEFNDGWSKTTLQNVCEVNPRSNDLPNRFVYIDLESVENGRLLFQNEITKDGSPSRAQRLLEKGDIIYQTVRPYQKNNYLFNLDGDFVASTGYAQLRSNQNSSFLYQLLHTEKFVNKVLLRSTGSNYPAINSTDLKKIIFNIPSLPEQQKIADFLTAVDKRIELLEKKKTLLETYKKGVMKKIFTQEIRFKDKSGNDFTDWEELNMKKILVERKEYSTKGNGFDHVSLTKEGVIPKSKRYNRDFLVNDDDNKKYKVTYLNDICYNPANLKFGVICRNSYASGIFSPIYVTFKVKNQNPVFIGHLVSRQDFINRVRKYEEGTVYERQAVKPIDFLKFSVQIPSLSEQEKISRFIYQIDTLIDILKSQIENSKTWKKGLLQKMFV